jgi:glucose-1-phosphate thymidylyltransferase
MKAVILAAGEGVRLRPFTYSQPKVMIKVANKPILEYVVNALAQSGIRDIVMVIGYKKERIMSYFESGKKFGVKIKYVVQEKQLGTAHALQTAEKYLKDDFLVLPGDNLIDTIALRQIVEAGANSVLLTESKIPSQYGVVSLSGGLIRSIVEKPEARISNIISTGIYMFKPVIFEYIRTAAANSQYDVTSALQYMLPSKKIKAVITKGIWIDAVYPWDLIDVNATALHNCKLITSGKVEKNVTIKGQVEIGEGSVIKASTYIVGPVTIGAGCEIGPNVCIYPATSIGNDVSIQQFTTIENSIIMDGVKIGTNSLISHSVIGAGVKIGPQVSMNVSEARVFVNGEVHNIPRIGALIGEDTDIESSVIFLAGTTVGAHCKIGAGVKVIKNIPNKTNVLG